MAATHLHADDLILFAHTVQTGSFTRAAQRTGLPKATLSRRLSLLEGDLGERLMQRSTRRLVLTEFGERMLEYALRLMDENDAAVALVQNERVQPRGILRVSLPPEYREFLVPQLVTRYLDSFPDVQLELDLSARRVDLVAERFDIAVRVATRLPDDSTLVARHIATLQNSLFASRRYLDDHGRPREPSDLLAHTGLMLAPSAGRSHAWQLSRDGQFWQGTPRRTVVANSVGLQQALAVQGVGIVGLSDHFAQDTLGLGELVRVLPGWCLPSVNVWCVTPGRRLLPKRTAAFIDVLTATLAQRDPPQGAAAVA